MKDTLAALSEAATQGPYRTYRSFQSYYVVGADDFKLAHCYNAEDQEFLFALVNAYRSGQLVPVPSVETVARAMCRAPGSLCVGFCHSEHCHEAVAQYGEQANAVIAALAGEQ